MTTSSTLGGLTIALGGAELLLRPTGAIWLAAEQALIFSDLHLGRSERVARRGGPLLPPYETEEALTRLEREVRALAPRRVLSLGDGFDDAAAATALTPEARSRLDALARGRDWLWIAGNHDPAPVDAPGECAPEASLAGLDFRHIAARALSERAEVSGHFHPKAVLNAGGRRIARRCFLADAQRLVAPAFCAYAGGLDVGDPAFDALFPKTAAAHLLCGDGLVSVPRSGSRAG